tara:strand:- start:120 stop:452 length:333 start_codon:yes stop_codon:yes gene_type:complete
MIEYNFPDHLKGDSFKSRKITFGFDLTGSRVDIQFKQSIGSSKSTFSWSTFNTTIEVFDAINGVIILKGRILDVPKNTYYYDCQIIDASGFVKTYFYGKMQINQDITEIL